ncbi:MAG: hypothetical protein IKZ30_01330 [Oscillospiraceae bacterium]|nr:hypothetical protein [Oscillospiraceae bacterium]
MINPIQMLVSALNNGMDPRAMMNQMLGQDPRMGQAMQMLQGKSPAELKQMAENMAKERGTTVEQIAQSLGIKMR